MFWIQVQIFDLFTPHLLNFKKKKSVGFGEYAGGSNQIWDGLNSERLIIFCKASMSLKCIKGGNIGFLFVWYEV